MSKCIIVCVSIDFLQVGECLWIELKTHAIRSE